MRLIVAGGRNLNDTRFIHDAIDKILCNTDLSEVELVCGMARGVDMVAFQWANKNNVPIKEFPADWDAHGKAAGPIRNRQMSNYATHLIAFHDGVSRGTKNMLEEANKVGLRVRVVKYSKR